MATHVFYSPHSDDEAIGMAGAIIRAKAEGHRVVLVLVTDNLASERGLARFGKTVEELSEARRREFEKAAARLEVNEVRYLGLREVVIMNDRDFALASLLGAMTATEHEFVDKGEDCIHHTVMGAGDIHRELGRSTHAHRLCEDAAALFAIRNPVTNVFAHAVYIYSFPPDERAEFCHAMRTLELTPAEREKKRQVLDAYKADGDCIGYGYDSVADLIDAAAADPLEYFIVL